MSSGGNRLPATDYKCTVMRFISLLENCPARCFIVHETATLRRFGYQVTRIYGRFIVFNYFLDVGEDTLAPCSRFVASRGSKI